MIDHKAVMFQQMLAQLIQIVTADMEQPAAAGTLQVKMLLAQMRLIGEELIAGAALAVQHIFPHHALFHQLFQRR